VYRAFDPKIGREVAIKVLPAELAANKERVARFEQEAQAPAHSAIQIFWPSTMSTQRATFSM